MKNSILLFVLTCLFACQSNKEKENLDKKPNFLFILTDDQTFETIHALNNNEIQTPNIDKLSSEAVTFTHCFNQGSWSGAVCVASRSMLITGQTVFNAPKNRAYLGQWARSKQISGNTEVPLWAEVFSDNGYTTFLTGKWHNSKYAIEKSFDKAIAIGAGMYETYDSTGSKKPGFNRASSESEWKPWSTEYTGHWIPRVSDLITDKNGIKKVGKPYINNKHTSELYADTAIEYLLGDAKSSKKPFFMYVAFNAPHDPRQAPKEFVDKYPSESIKIPVNFLGEHPFDQGDHKIRDERLAPFPRTKEAVQLHRSEYYAMITHLDKEIGKILDALEKTGKSENTYVILSSDHGIALGQHGLMGKQNQYDHSIRMPLIIKGPGLSKGRIVKNKVYLQSMFATTCDLAFIDTPKTVDFKSIRDLLIQGDDGGEEYIFGTYLGYQRMIRSDEYKLIVYPKIKKTQLFDLINDPYERNNLASEKEYLKIKKELFEKLISKQKQLGDYMVLDIKNYIL